jgi:hypothetical protein
MNTTKNIAIHIWWCISFTSGRVSQFVAWCNYLSHHIFSSQYIWLTGDLLWQYPALEESRSVFAPSRVITLPVSRFPPASLPIPSHNPPCLPALSYSAETIFAFSGASKERGGKLSWLYDYMRKQMLKWRGNIRQSNATPPGYTIFLLGVQNCVKRK